MKKKAFLQALALVLLLLLSWVLLVQRLGRDGEPLPAAEDIPPEQTEVPDASTEGARAMGRLPSAQPPAEWTDWIDFLQSREPGPERIRRMLELRDSLFRLPPEEAVNSILFLLQSGYNLDTGGVFRSGPEGGLASAGSLRAFLLDWLGQLDPETAAAYAMTDLETFGTDMPAPEYALQVRNFAWGTPEDSPGRNDFLRQRFLDLLNNTAWMRDPGPAVAESMDIAVYLGDSSLVPQIASLRRFGQPEVLQHAGDLALERLVDQQQLPAVRQLLDSAGGRQLRPRARAGYVARLDPVDDASRGLLRDYLADQRTSPSEATDFLAYFPNLNRSLSHNLLSRDYSDTTPADTTGRLRRALAAVESWQADPALAAYAGELEATRQRLLRQLSGEAGP